MDLERLNRRLEMLDVAVFAHLELHPDAEDGPKITSLLSEARSLRDACIAIGYPPFAAPDYEDVLDETLLHFGAVEERINDLIERKRKSV